jgi:hypothetical protein
MGKPMYKFLDGTTARVGQRATVNGQSGVVLAKNPGAIDPQLVVVLGENPSLFDNIPDTIHETAEALPA